MGLRFPGLRFPDICVGVRKTKTRKTKTPLLSLDRWCAVTLSAAYRAYDLHGVLTMMNDVYDDAE